MEARAMAELVDRVGGARTAGAQDPPADLQAARTRLRAVLADEGLSATDMRQLLGELCAQEADALNFLLEGGPVPSRKVVRKVLELLEDRLGDGRLCPAEIAGPIERVGRRLADAVGLTAGVLCGYIVLGGLIEGESLLLGKPGRVLGLLLFAGVLAVLALFEALHTSATMLKLADLDALAERYPRASSLHRLFRTNHGLARFLAGRQMVVVITVFICSPLSSFPEMTQWPLTDQALPDVLRPFIVVGLPGALFVLWFGQLVPQFLATRHAVSLTNTRVVSGAFRTAYALEASGFARPGFWMSAWDKDAETIPSSPSRRWKETAREITGYGGVAQVREWTVTATGAQLRAISTTRVYRDARSVTDGALLVPGSPARLTLDASAARLGKGRLVLAPTEYREEVLPSGDRRFHKPLVSAVGSFSAEDTLRVTLDADWTTDPARDLIHVERPVRFVLLRVRPNRPPVAMGAALLRTFIVGDGLGDLVEQGPGIRIEPIHSDDGLPLIEHAIHFPPPGTLYTLDWEIELDV